MKRLFLLLLGLSSLLWAYDKPTPEQQDTWITPGIAQQIDSEDLDDRKGLGRIFLPAMTYYDYEPFYTVTDDKGAFVGSAHMGNSVFVRPGYYKVYYGSGADYQRLEQDVRVFSQNVTVPHLDWGCLTIKVIDENRNSLTDRYELFDMNGESYGTGYGVQEELGEKLVTWVLRPGRYKVVVGGHSFNTYRDFTTLRVNPGEMLPYTLVIDTETDRLIGSGTLDTNAGTDTGAGRLSSALHLNANFTSDNTNSSSNPETSVTLTGQVDNTYTYEQYPYHYTGKQLLELGTSKESGADLRVASDDLTLRNTFVYYFYQNLGTYGRGDADLHFFPTYVYPSDRDNYLLTGNNGDTLSAHLNVNRLRIQPGFYPLGLKEGAGFNLRMLNSPKAVLNVRFGLGFRQEFNHNSYVYAGTVTDSTSRYYNAQVYRQLDNYFQKGTEASITGNFQLINNLSWNTTAEILFPFDKNQSQVVDWENILNLRLFKYVSIDYKINLTYNDDLYDHTIITHNLYLRLSYNLY